MNGRLNWYLVAWAAALVVAAGTTKNVHAYQYVLSGPNHDSDSDSTPDSSTSTHIEEAEAAAEAPESGYCTASVRTYTWAKDGDSASAESYGWGEWSKSWQWDGPPGTAPGGTLQWVAHGSGNAFIEGYTEPGQSGSASCSAYGCAISGGAGSGGSGGAGCAWVSGSVQDNDMGQVDGDAYATYGDNFGDPNEEDYGEFAGYAWWSCNEGDYTSIPSGTSYVDFAGEVDCCNGSSGSAGPDESGAVTDASSSASAVVYLYADLDE